MSFFFSSAYPESTFLMLSLAAFLAARSEKWLLACICGMCLAATRNLGIFILLPLLLEYFRPVWGKEVPRRAVLHPRLLFFLLVPLGACYFLWEGYMRLPDPWLYWHAKLVSGGVYLQPSRSLRILKTLPPFYLWLSSVSVLFTLALWVGAFLLKIRASYLAYTAALIYMSFCTPTPEALPRFLSILFPLFIVLALLTARWKWSYEPLLVSCITALTFCTILRATGYWIV